MLRIKTKFLQFETNTLKVFQTSRKIFYSCSLIAFLIAVLLFQSWYTLFPAHTFPVTLKMAATDLQYVRVYWDDPALYPKAYEKITVNASREPSPWQVKIEALAEKNPLSVSTEVWILDLSTPQQKVDWSKAEMIGVPWELRDQSDAPQGKVALAYNNGPQTLKASLQGEDLTLKLKAHHWSGKVRVTVNNHVQELDLYRPVEKSETVTLTFSTVVSKPGDGSLQDYTLNVTQSAWSKLRFVPEGQGSFQLESLEAKGQKSKLNSAGNEATLPFNLKNKFNFAVVATFIGFFWMLLLFISVVHLWLGQFHKRFSVWSYMFGMAPVIGAFWTLVFYPATMSPDSLSQWGQAMTNRYNDWHPIGMTLLIRGVMILVPNFSSNAQAALFSFLQGTLFWLAIFYTIHNFIKAPKLKFFLLIGIIFYYPLWVYSVTIWKDVWAATWLLLFTVELYKFLYQDRKRYWLHFLTTTLFCTFAILTRHNILITALIIALTFSGLLFFKLGKREWLKISGLLMAIVIISITITELTYVLVNTEHINTTNMYLNFDVIGTLYFTGEKAENLQNLAIYQEFGQANLDRAINGYSCEVDLSYIDFGANAPFPVERIVKYEGSLKDLTYLVTTYPLPFLEHRMCTISGLFQVSRVTLPQFLFIMNNPYGLSSSSKLPQVWSYVKRFLASNFTPNSWFTIPYKHGLLLLLATVAAIILYKRVKQIDRMLPTFFLLMVGIAYLLPYLIVTGSDWRYLLFSHICWLLSLIVSIQQFFVRPAVGSQVDKVEATPKEEPRIVKV